MSLAPHDSPPPSKTELETVTRWPAVLAAAGAGILLLGVPLLLACASVLRSPPREAIARRTPQPQAPARPVSVQPLEFPTPTPPPPAPREEPRPAARIVVVRPAVAPAPRPAPEPVADEPVRERTVRSRFLVRHDRSELEYLEGLKRFARDVDLEAEKGASAQILREAAEACRMNPPDAGKPSPAHPLLALLPKRPDLAGLPARGAADCQRDAKTAARMGEISTDLRRFQARRVIGRRSSQAPPTSLSHQDSVDLLDMVRDEWLKEDGIPTLVQMLQAGDTNQRLGLVQVLVRSTARASTEALAGRALYDLSPEVREAAVRALGARQADHYRPILLRGLRHLWPPVADHAAEALAALNEREAVPDLVDLLDEPDPCAPQPAGDGIWVVSELVRVNHLRNCLLCHAPALDRKDPVRGVVPTPGQPLPQVYYDRGSGAFVRADVTYLQQDFSLMEPVAKPDKWPAVQRFDYLVRRRPLTPAEVKARKAAVAAREPGTRPVYPQREAVVFALRELTGLQAGDSSLDWRIALLTGGTLLPAGRVKSR
jgi:hypothetical protein